MAWSALYAYAQHKRNSALPKGAKPGRELLYTALVFAFMGMFTLQQLFTAMHIGQIARVGG